MMRSNNTSYDNRSAIHSPVPARPSTMQGVASNNRGRVGRSTTSFIGRHRGSLGGRILTSSVCPIN
jgi:hypothetical protein